MHFLYCCSVGLLPGYWPGCPRGPSASRISSFIRAKRNLTRRQGQMVSARYTNTTTNVIVSQDVSFRCSQGHNVSVSRLHSNAQRVLAVLVHLRLGRSSLQEQTHLPADRTAQRRTRHLTHTAWYVNPEVVFVLHSNWLLIHFLWQALVLMCYEALKVYWMFRTEDFFPVADEVLLLSY